MLHLGDNQVQFSVRESGAGDQGQEVVPAFPLTFCETLERDSVSLFLTYLSSCAVRLNVPPHPPRTVSWVSHVFTPQICPYPFQNVECSLQAVTSQEGQSPGIALCNLSEGPQIGFTVKASGGDRESECLSLLSLSSYLQTQLET